MALEKKGKKKKFDGREGRPISLEKATKWTKRYRKSKDYEEDPVKAHFFGCDIIEKILAEPGCKGIRIYYGLNEKKEKQLLLVGCNDKGNNILKAEIAGKDGGDAIIADESVRCPNMCPVDEDDPLTWG